MPQDRDGRFSTGLFERYRRSERALVATLAEMYVQGVSTRKVEAVTEGLCGHAFSASAISAVDKRPDESLSAFARRRLGEPFAYLVLDARYGKVREAGLVVSRAVLVAVGTDREGRRQVLAVELADREGRSSWKDFLLGLRERGLCGVEFVVADDHAGLRAAPREILPGAFVQRCGACPPARAAGPGGPLPQERARPPAAQGRRRPPARATLDLRSARARRGRGGPGRLAEEVAASPP